MSELQIHKNLESLIENTKRRLAHWTGRDDAVSLEALEELRVVIEELRTLNDELTTQNDAFLDVHKILEEKIRYESLFQDAPLGYLLMNSTGKIEKANSAACKLFRMPLKSIKGTLLSEYVESGSKNDIHRFIQTCKSDLVARESEFLFKPLDGDVFPVLLSASVFLEAGGIQIRCLIKDVSEQNKIHDELVVNARKLQIQNSELEKFAKIAAHDLQEPMRAVSIYAQLLKENHAANLTEEAEAMLGFICESAETALARIHGILHYTSADSLESDFEDVDTWELVDSVIQRVRPELTEKGIHVSIDELPRVRADYDRLEIVFENLITNAIKFSHGREPSIWISVEKLDKFWLFTVRDNGIGFDQRFADKVFLLFHRLHSNDSIPGTGIGLTVTKKIVEQHGGRIWVLSEPGKGAKFFFTLPC